MGFPFEIHLFRITTPHMVQRVQITVDFPVSGFVLVPSGTADVHSYVQQRQNDVAVLRMGLMAQTGGEVYGKLAATMLMTPEVRGMMRLGPRMPDARLQHSNPASRCTACRSAALCLMPEASYPRVRTALEEICRLADRRMTLDEIRRLEAYLNKGTLLNK